MLSFTNLSIRRGPRVLLEHATFTIHRGHKVGITGANGTGKSSLFALIMDELSADTGDFDMPANLVVAHVAQESATTDLSLIHI